MLKPGRQRKNKMAELPGISFNSEYYDNVKRGCHGYWYKTNFSYDGFSTDF
jgi:hypothetical protein